MKKAALLHHHHHTLISSHLIQFEMTTVFFTTLILDFLPLCWLFRQQPVLRCNALRMLLHIKHDNYLFVLILKMSQFFLLFTCCLFTHCLLIRAAIAKYVCTPAQTCAHACPFINIKYDYIYIIYMNEDNRIKQTTYPK